MKRYLPLIALLAALLTGCGFHLQHETEVPAQFKTMSYETGSPYGQLSRNIKEILKNNNVTLVNNDTSGRYPSLRITKEGLTKSTISLYQDGSAAEYQMVFTVTAQVVIAGKDIYPISVRVFRTFFDNPATTLAKSAEQTLIQNEMYQEAARQILRKLKSIDSNN